MRQDKPVARVCKPTNPNPTGATAVLNIALPAAVARPLTVPTAIMAAIWLLVVDRQP